MASSRPIKQLDGHAGYLRWKESMLLRAHTLGVARVLSEDPPAAAAGGDESATIKQWARDDAVCRGHILAALSDRLLPAYARFATAAEVWRALARTYDGVEGNAIRRFLDYSFNEEGDSLLLLEQIAEAHALGAAAEMPDRFIACALCGKLPPIVSAAVIRRSADVMDMDTVWDVARCAVNTGASAERLWSCTPM